MSGGVQVVLDVTLETRGLDQAQLRGPGGVPLLLLSLTRAARLTWAFRLRKAATGPPRSDSTSDYS